ncbi:MAG: SDR family NAD(P)-dependent oxidoreductase [Burkholderiales bacterium]
MLLENKVALVHGAAGEVGRKVAETFAAEGAMVWLTGRQSQRLAPIVAAIRNGGGSADPLTIDALDAASVDRCTEAVVQSSGRIDVVFNAIAVGQARTIIGPSTEVQPDVFLESFRTVVLSQFLTARSAARHMLRAGGGAIVLLTATPGRGVAPLMASHSAGHAAIEGLVKCLATEWGPGGIRVTGLMSGGMPETARIREVLSAMAGFANVPPEAMSDMARQKTQLKRMPTLEQTARAAAFLASDHAGSLSGTILNASCGEVVD